MVLIDLVEIADLAASDQTKLGEVGLMECVHGMSSGLRKAQSIAVCCTARDRVEPSASLRAIRCGFRGGALGYSILGRASASAGSLHLRK
jgi:hypothetical protein